MNHVLVKRYSENLAISCDVTCSFLLIEVIIITLTRLQSQMYTRIYISNFKTIITRRQKTKETKEERRIYSENLTGYDDIVSKVALCIFKLHTHFQEKNLKKIIKIPFYFSFSRLHLFFHSHKYVMIETQDYDKAHKDDENAMSTKVYIRVNSKAVITSILQQKLF